MSRTIVGGRAIAPLLPFDPREGILVKAPERAEPGYWVGCPGVLREAGRTLLTYRERHPRGTAPERGWRCAIAESTDGVTFADAWEVTKDRLGTSSMERFCLLPAPGGYQLFFSYVDPADNRWRVDLAEAASVEAFDVAKAEPVLTAASTGTEGVKDPYAMRVGPTVYLFASFARAGEFDADRAHGTADIYNVGVTTCPTGVATGTGGAGFRWHGTALDVGDGWDRYQARLNCVVPMDGSYLGFYDGSASSAENYEERCGLAVSGDLLSWTSVSPDGPWVSGPDGTGSVRYLDAFREDGEWWIYYEMTRADGAHELRLIRQ
ncbi:hypothetical protein [Spirillospora sp. CA-294931]|uniref:hypothetical protein n=1 Tax=Spirillospora sp. CA-294931 TaxID=3240042 RepID=UPI003D927FA1